MVRSVRLASAQTDGRRRSPRDPALTDETATGTVYFGRSAVTFWLGSVSELMAANAQLRPLPHDFPSRTADFELTFVTQRVKSGVPAHKMMVI